MNTTFTINLDATELVGALNNLAAALKSGVTPLAVEAAPDHTPEPQKLQEMQDKVIADIRQELAEERTAEAAKAGGGSLIPLSRCGRLLAICLRPRDVRSPRVFWQSWA